MPLMLADIDFSPISLLEVIETYLNQFLLHLPTFLFAVIILVVFVIIAKVARKHVETLSSKVIDDPSLQNLAGTAASVTLTIVGIFAAATILFPGLRAGDLVAVLGLSSVAIGFAFKDIFQNFLAGILLLLQRPFIVGDQIQVDDFCGTIEHIDIRSTTIRSYDGDLVIIPNADVYSSPVTVHTADDTRRTSFDTGVSYGEDIEHAREIILNAVEEECDLVLEKPAPRVIVTGHGDSSVDLRIQYWTESDRRSSTLATDQVATAVKYALDDADIEIPYPYRTVEFFDKSSEN